jgi:carbon-monoxide dehydrogenase medium subunit
MVLRDAAPGTAYVLAGGLDVLRQASRWEIAPKVLVSLREIPGLDTLDASDTIQGFEGADGAALVIGPMTTIRSIEKSALVAKGWPLLLQAARQISSVQVKGMGTVVGNLCSASPASDLAVALLALDAKVEAVAPGRETPDSPNTRWIALSDFFRGPGLTALAPGEVANRLVVPPAPSSGFGGAFLKLAHTKASIATVNAAAAVTVRDGVLSHIRLAAGAVAPTPVRAASAEALLRGKEPEPELIARAVRSIEADISPISDLRAGAEYRRTTVRVLAGRVLTEAIERALPGNETIGLTGEGGVQ